MKDIKIKDTALNTNECIQYVNNAGAGGHVVFIGTVRNQTSGKKVIRLEFEAYIPMAVKEMEKICDRMTEQWPDVIAISMHHRIGPLMIGEIPVIIAVSSPHRRIAFEACQFAIDILKETVPIWKKEIFEDGDVWVAAHP